MEWVSEGNFEIGGFMKGKTLSVLLRIEGKMESLLNLEKVKK